MRLAVHIGLLGIVLVAGGCSVKRVPSGDPKATAPPQSSPTYDPQREAASPPPPAVEPEAAGTATPPPNLEVPEPARFDGPEVRVQDLPASAPPAAAAPPATTTSGGGYRVQVLASTDRSAAERLRREIETRLGEPVTVVYQAPHYKVRVGDCPTSEACRDLQERLRQSGYETVWIVSDSTP
jgi:rare lipoprotein A